MEGRLTDIKSINEHIPLNEDLEVFLYQETGLEISNIERSYSPSPISETIKVHTKLYGNTIFKFNLREFSNEIHFYKLVNNQIDIIPNLFKIIDSKSYTLTIIKRENGANGEDLFTDFPQSKRFILECIETIKIFYKKTDSLKEHFKLLPSLTQKNIYFQDQLLEIDNILKEYFPECLSHGDFLPYNIIQSNPTKLLDFQLISKGYVIEDLYQFYSFLTQNNIITSHTEAKEYWLEVIRVFKMDLSLTTLFLLLEKTRKKNTIKLFSHFLEIQEKKIINKKNQHNYPVFFQHSDIDLINMTYSMLEKKEN